jgi:hypothetical protein
MITNINYRSYIVFAVINFATIPCVYFFYVSFPPWLCLLLLTDTFDTAGNTQTSARGDRFTVHRPSRRAASELHAGCPELQEPGVQRHYHGDFD